MGVTSIYGTFKAATADAIIKGVRVEMEKKIKYSHWGHSTIKKLGRDHPQRRLRRKDK